jgi:hypothetical protein
LFINKVNNDKQTVGQNEYPLSDIFLKYKIEYPVIMICLRGLVVFFLFFITTCLSGQKPAQINQHPEQSSVGQGIPATVLNPVIRSIEDFINRNQENQHEKIYIHTDRTDYMQGDTIWFKAYLWFGYDQIPDTASGILYADLISSDGRVILKRKLLIQNGTAIGDFSLDTTIIPGRYSLLAYTRLMQNLNSGVPFYLTITINPVNQKFQFECIPFIIKQPGNDTLKIGMKFFEVDRTGSINNSVRHKIIYSLKIGDHLPQADSILAENTKGHVFKYSLAGISKQDSVAEFKVSVNDNHLTSEKQIRIPLQDNIDLQFFPEGGRLVSGLGSRIAFKATGEDGLGRDIAGEIRTGDDVVVSGFKSTNRGMGSFRLKPDTEKEYFAHFWYHNQKYIVPLPGASKEGCAMSVSFKGNIKDPFISLKKISSGEISTKYIIGSAYGKIWFSALVKTFTDSCRLRVPLELLPEGVCRLTVLNVFFEPECERLIYIDKNQRLKIEVIPDSSSYGARSKITLQVKAYDSGGTPVRTSLSLTVTDIGLKDQNSAFSGICAYKLLESELQGYIEDADSYFKGDSVSDSDALDLLLLTQGYRKFLPPETNNDRLKFSPEKYFDISGNIKFSGNKSGEKKFNYHNIDLTLISISEKPYFRLSHPDSLGNFIFQFPLMSGKQHLMLQAATPKKKHFNGDIFLNDPVAPPKLTGSLPVYNTIISPAAEYVSRIQAFTKSEITKIPLPGSMSRTLEEVVVKAKANPKNWWRNYEKDATKIADLDFLDPGGDRYMNINDLLVKEFGARWYNNERAGLNTVLLPCIKLVERGMNFWFPIYLVDGNVYWNGKDFDFSKLNTLSAYPVNEIKKILVIPPGKNIVMNNAYKPIIGFPQFILQSMVIIETYSKNTYRGDIQGVKKFVLDGLNAPRLFYSPRYEGTLRNSPAYDGRATLFWEPSVKTDSTGQAKVEFFTGDRKAELEVIVNGIESETGYPGQGKTIINSDLKK